MKGFVAMAAAAVLLFSLAACGGAPEGGEEGAVSQAASSREAASSIPPAPEEGTAPAEEAEEASPASSRGEETEAGPEREERRIQVRCGGETVTYALNDSPAAASLLEQLPLTVEVEDYSTNEKIFYPPGQLDTDGTPTAAGGAGTLAYYAPWGDVVMFYGDFGENPSLFQLGQVVAGGELVSQLEGTITITAAEQTEKEQ